MASSIQKLHDHYLICLICIELYKDPCTLVCGHTFCKECLVKYTKIQPRAIKAKSILCPNCRQMTTVHNTDRPVEDWVKDIKPSFLIRGLLDDFASQAGVDTCCGNLCIPCTQTGERNVGLFKHTDVPWDISFVVSDEHKTGCHLQLGRLIINEEKPIITDFNPNCKPTLVDTICFKTKHCMKTPGALDVKVLNVNGIETLVITDCSNKSVKSFYTRDKQARLSILQLSSLPWTSLQLNDNTVAVSYCFGNVIAVVNVTPDPVLRYNINTRKTYRCLAIINKKNLVAGCLSSSSLDIIDMSGQVLRLITPSESLINRPFALAVTKEGNILVSDSGSDSLYCLTQEGQVVFKIPANKHAFVSPRGVVISNSGYILLSDSNNKVVQLTSTGEFVRDILTSDNICKPYRICLYNHKLYVVQYGDSLKVFSLV